MPCDSVAVARATIDANVRDEVLGKPGVAEALRRWAEQTYGSARVYNADSYMLGLVVGNRPQFVVQITAQGLSLRPMSRRDEEYTRAELAKWQTFASQLAKYTAKERLLARLKSKYRVVADEKSVQGRTLTLEV